MGRQKKDAESGDKLAYNFNYDLTASGNELKVHILLQLYTLTCLLISNLPLVRSFL